MTNKIIELIIADNDFRHLNKFLLKNENNQLEAKEAKNGLPNSIWETYSAFANSYGGIILLGVTENYNKEFL